MNLKFIKSQIKTNSKNKIITENFRRRYSFLVAIERKKNDGLLQEALWLRGRHTAERRRHKVVGERHGLVQDESEQGAIQSALLSSRLEQLSVDCEHTRATQERENM